MRRAIFACLLLGCGPVRLPSDIENPPELRNPPPVMEIRVGFAMSPADKEYAYTDRQARYEVGPRFWIELENQFALVFREATALPSLDRGGEFDFGILVQNLQAEARMDGWGGGDIVVQADFVVHPRGGAVERIHETVSIPLQPTSQEEAGRVTKVLSRAVILQFLRKFRAKYGDARTSEPRATTPGAGRGLYALEQDITFNVLDAVVYDAATGALSLQGHWDPSQPGIPYLQHLAELLEHPEPRLSIVTTADSDRRVDEWAQTTFGPQWGRVLTKTGEVSADGRLLLPALGVKPTSNGGPPGSLGIRIEYDDNHRLIVRSSQVPEFQAGDEILGYYNQDHLDWTMRAWGAGARVKIRRIRGDDFKEIEVTLGEAGGDAWSHVWNYDVIAMLYRLAGRNVEARVLRAVNLVMRLYPRDEWAAGSAMISLVDILGLTDTWEDLKAQVREGKISRAQGEAGLSRAIAGGLDRALSLSVVLSTFDQSTRGGRKHSDALDDAIRAMGSPVSAVVDEIIAAQVAKVGVVRLDPDEAAKIYGLRFEVVPDTRDLAMNSRLAQVMWEADYLLKRLKHAPGLGAKIPKYETLIEWHQANPSKGFFKGTWRYWISIGSVDAAESSDGAALRLGAARMKIQARERSGDQDLPEVTGGYDELLSSLYDHMALEFPVLHELRECAKLAAAARWLRTKNPDLRLPKSGRSQASVPKRAPGILFLYVTGRPALKAAYVAEGGVDLRSPKEEPRKDPTFEAPKIEPQVYRNETLQRVLKHKTPLPDWRPVGWVARANRGERTMKEMEQVLTVLANSKVDPGEADQVRRRVEECVRLSKALDAIEDQLNVLTLKGRDRVAALERIETSLTEAAARNRENAAHLIQFSLQQMAGRVKDLSSARLTGGKAEGLEKAVEDLEELKSRYELVQKGTEGMPELLLELVKQNPAVEWAVALKDSAEVIQDLTTLARSAKELRDLDPDADNARLRDLILPIQKRLNRKIDEVRNDPLVKKYIS